MQSTLRYKVKFIDMISNTIIKQPKDSQLCGHCCLSYIFEIPLEKSIGLLSHTHGTSTKELTKFFKHSETKRGVPNVYSLCKVHFSEAKNTHWVIMTVFNKHRYIYEPAVGDLIEYSVWKEVGKCRITSYIEIL